MTVAAIFAVVLVVAAYIAIRECQTRRPSMSGKELADAMLKLAEDMQKRGSSDEEIRQALGAVYGSWRSEFRS
jgi:cytochrome c-type biogenesis protein CcmH/NrfF